MKRIVAFLLATILMCSTFVPAISASDSDTERKMQDTYSITVQDLFEDYPFYLNNEVVNKFLSIYINEYQRILTEKSQNTGWAAFVSGLKNGAEIIGREFLSIFGVQSNREKLLYDTVFAFMHEAIANESLTEEVAAEIGENFSIFKDMGTVTDIAEEVVLAWIKKSCKRIPEKEIEEMFSSLLKEGKNLVKKGKTSVKAIQLVLAAFQLQEIELAMIEKLFLLVPEEGVLYEGLQMLQMRMRLTPAEYALDAYFNDNAIGFLDDAINAAMGETISSGAILTAQILIRIYTDIIYNGPTGEDIAQANYFSASVSEMRQIVNSMQLKFANKKLKNEPVTKQEMNDYEFVINLYFVSVRLAFEYIGKMDKKSWDMSNGNLLEMYNDTITYDVYIKQCLKTVQENEDIVTGDHYVVDSSVVSEETVLIRIKDLARKLGISKIDGKTSSEGIYFTVNQKTCATTPHSSCSNGNCRNENIFAASWFKDIFGTVKTSQIPGHSYPNGSSGYPVGSTCHGFANFAQWYIFADDSVSTVTNKRIVGTQSDYSNGVKFSKSVLDRYAKPGDILRDWKSTTSAGLQSGHSSIYISHDDEGAWVLDCNFWESVNGATKYVSQVRYHKILYKDRPYPIAITRADNYNVSGDSPINSSETISVNEQWKVDRGTTNLRIRSGPSTSYTQVGLVTYGDTVTVTKINNNWGYVTYKGVSGWICLDYCSKLTTTPPVEPSKTQYRYYHYTDGKGNYSVCAYYGKSNYGGTWKREDTGWLDAPLKMVSNSATSYIHVQQGSACTNAGCTDSSWTGGKYQDGNGVSWYCEEKRTTTVSEQCSHTYSSSVTKDATCTASGTQTYTCTKCGNTKTEAIAKLSHSYDSGKVTKTATCGTSGTKTYTCSKCGATKTETIAKVSTHTYNNGVVTKEATCESSGTNTYTCTVCSATKNETITKLGHSYDNGEVTKEATCGTSGTKVFTCLTCGATKTEKISKESAHAYDEGVIKKIATCESDGVIVRVCVICNATKTEAIEKLGHDYAIIEPSVEPTCSSNGKTAVEECITCGTTRGGKSISKTKHEYSSEYTVDKEPTCTEKGSKSQYCIFCGEKGKSTSIAKAEHTYGDWEIARAPQPGKKGSKQRMCIYCEHKDTESIAAITKIKNDKRIIMTIGCVDATVFGKATENDVAPKLVKNRTMLPARFVAENLGATVEWDGDNRQVTITKKDIKIVLFIDQSTAYINEQPVTLDSLPFIEADRTYTPVRFIAEALGATVAWDESVKQVTITKN